MKRRNNEMALALGRLFPEFGERALDIPAWDSGKRMYLVDQYQSASGNRSLTYVGVSDQLLLEMTLGHFHSWEFVNKVRAFAYDGTGFRVICSCDWKQSTHYNREEVIPVVAEALTEYVMQSGTAEKMGKTEVSAEVDRILGDLFGRTGDDLDRRGARRILMAYCESRHICRDFTDD